MSEITLLYFFSALAQSAASLSAIAAVFAVFKLQANQSVVRERYSEANDALNAGWHYRFSDSRLKADLKYKANEIKNDTTDGKREKAKLEELLGRIEEAEKLSGELADQLACPLKLWVGIFLSSLPMFALAKLCEGWLGVLVAGVFVLVSGVAVWRTKVFVQGCLQSESQYAGAGRLRRRRRREGGP